MNTESALHWSIRNMDWWRRRGAMVESSSTLPRYGRRPFHVVSNALRRRRNKTVHFGDNLLASEFLEPNVQQLFSFIETVLSAWVLEEDGDDNGRRRRTRSFQHTKRTPSDVVELIGKGLNGDRDIGCLKYKHRHWNTAPDRCNASFLSKVTWWLSCCSQTFRLSRKSNFHYCAGRSVLLCTLIRSFHLYLVVWEVFPLRFVNGNYVRISQLLLACCMSHQYTNPWLAHLILLVPIVQWRVTSSVLATHTFFITAVFMENQVLWDVSPRRLVNSYRLFGGVCLHLHDPTAKRL